MMEIKELFPIQDCEFEINDKLITVSYTNKKPSFIEKIFFRNQLKKPYKVDLDEIGSFIWKNCNGKNTVEDIINLSKNEFNENVSPAEQRVVLFINQMTKNKLIKLYKKVVNEQNSEG